MLTVYLVNESYFDDDGGLGGGGTFGQPKLLKAFQKKSDANKFLEDHKKNILKKLNALTPLWNEKLWNKLTDEKKLWHYKWSIDPLKVN
jgi:hypothetical protein